MMEPEYKNGSESLRGLETGLKEGSNTAHTTLEYDREDRLSRKDFKDGTEYLNWLEKQLPYLEEFESDDVVHHYFFRSWSREIYYPEMESLIEETEEDLDLSDEYVEDTMDREETVWEEGTKPEFKDGRQLVEWLGRRLSFLEPFAPQDAIHYCFHREWSRDKFQPKLDLLVEDDIEEKTEEEDFEEIAREQTAKEESIDETTKEENIEEANKEEGIGETAEEKSMEDIAEESGMEEAANEESIEGMVKEKGIEDVTQEEGMEELAKEKGEKETAREDNKDEVTKEKGLERTAEEKVVEKNSKEEGMPGNSRDAELTGQDGYVEEENGDLHVIHPYIKMMTCPLILGGFLSKKQETKTLNTSTKSKEQRDETETMSNFWSADEKQKKSKIYKLWSRFNPFNHKNKNETEKMNHAKKERRAKKSILSRFFRRNRGDL